VKPLVTRSEARQSATTWKEIISLIAMPSSDIEAYQKRLATAYRTVAEQRREAESHSA